MAEHNQRKNHGMTPQKIPKKDGANSKWRRAVFRTCLTLIIIAAIGFIALSLPIFYVNNIVLNGANHITREDIEASLALGKKRSIFTVIPPLLENDIKSSTEPYLKDVSISLKLPDTLEVNIIERIPRAYLKLPNMDTLVIVDEEGMTLGTTGFPENSLPVVVGMDLQNFTIGQYADQPNGKSVFGKIMLISSILCQNNIQNDSDGSGSLEVNLSKADDIHLYIGGVDVEFGTLDDANEKALTALECINHLPKGVKGFLDVKSSNSQATFRYLK